MCPCGRPLRLSHRSPLCAVCAYLVRVAKAEASKIEREFKRDQLRQWVARRVAA